LDEAHCREVGGMFDLPAGQPVASRIGTSFQRVAFVIKRHARHRSRYTFSPALVW
jgi:hypothetical protein